MSKCYIPEETYAVCTFQMGSAPQKFIASRDKVSVFHKDKPLLTEKDKNLDVQFTCKSPVSFAASFLAFGAGLLVGALLLSNPIGWVVAGCLAVAVGVAYVVKSVTHKCTSPMKGGNWVFYHPNVKFNGYYAITQVSILSCSSGGIVKPFFSYTLASAAAKRIRSINYAEVGTNTVISFFAGVFLPGTLSSIATVKAAGIFLATNVAGLGITWTVQYGQREIMRNDEDLSYNEVYENMNEEVDENTFIQTFDDPSDPNDLESLVFFQKAIKEGKIVSQNLNVNQMIDRFSNMTTAQLKNSTEYKQFLKDVSKGTYGEGLKKSMSNIFGKVKPNSSSVRKGMNYTAENFKGSLKQMAKAGGMGCLFFLPFVATYFSENARKAFAEEAVKDMTNGINVVTETPQG
jgi:hypothetical protein